MRGLLSLMVAAMMIMFASSVFAMPDAEYNKLKATSQAFNEADKELCDIWKETYPELKGEHKKRIKKEQLQWIKSGWDKEAKEFMKEGLSKDKAYAKAAHERANVLRAISHNSNLTAENSGSAKADNYYNSMEDAKEESEKEQQDIRQSALYGFMSDLRNERKLMMYVVGQGEAGGADGQFKRAKDSFDMAMQSGGNEEKMRKAIIMAWCFGVDSLRCISGMGLSAEEELMKRGEIKRFLVEFLAGFKGKESDLDSCIKHTYRLLQKAEDAVVEENNKAHS